MLKFGTLTFDVCYFCDHIRFRILGVLLFIIIRVVLVTFKFSCQFALLTLQR